MSSPVRLDKFNRRREVLDSHLTPTDSVDYGTVHDVNLNAVLQRDGSGCHAVSLRLAVTDGYRTPK